MPNRFWHRVLIETLGPFVLIGEILSIRRAWVLFKVLRFQPVLTRRSNAGRLYWLASGKPSRWSRRNGQGPRHCGAHEKKFEERCRCKETTVRLRVSQKAHGLGLEVHRLAKIAECARIVRTVVGRINVVRGAVVGHQFQNQGSRQELLRENVCENQVVPVVRSVHHKGASWGQDAGHLPKGGEWGRQ